MRFDLTDDQRDFAASLDALVAGSDPVAAVRSWAAGDTAPGRALWRRLAEQGVPALVVPEDDGGLGASPVELVLAMEVLGRHAVPGPWIESAALLATVLSGPERQAVVDGALATAAAPPLAPLALDAETADLVFLVDAEGTAPASAGDPRRSVDASRRLAPVGADGPHREVAADVLARGLDLATLAAAAQLLGAGERVLADAVAYVKQRRQFGREIGSYQAIKHHLADVRIALDFARPLVFGAALDPTPRAVSAAKVAASDAAYFATRTGLQVHGAIGYTREFDLSIWITRVRALVGAWGTPTHHRARLLDDLLTARAGGGGA